MARDLRPVYCAVTAVSLGCVACSDGAVPPSGGTETNVQPAPCSTDEDCGDAGACLLLEGSADAGFCEAPER
ncbi:hypothetical protein [Sorangium sp. So ce1182]|uniref:hypothetical protein n=1 Tax=Sorangium sp. So ce1182 TaxID=3133334 RepID=UPI003F5E1582